MSTSRQTACGFLLATLLLALGTLVASAQSGYRLTILHTGENHGHWDVFTQTVSLGGIARRATLVQRVRAEGGNTLLLDSGDVSQGTLYFSRHRMSEGAAFYNALGYDAVGIGNHEFDLGLRTFVENWLANARFGIVSTNLDFSGDPLLAGKVPSYLIKTLGGEKVGILGFTTEDVAFSSNLGPTVRIKPRIEAARTAIAELAAQGANKVVAISHLGFVEDRRLAAEADGIDVIAGGHTPTLLGDAAQLPASFGTPEGPYPTVMRSPGGNPVLIVFAADWGKVLGRLDVTFDAGGIATQWGGSPIVVDAAVPEDTAVEALRQRLAAPLDAYRRAVVGKVALDLDGSTRTLRSAETPIGNLVADAMLAAARGDGAQIALMNGGGIRAGLKAGDVTVGQVLEILPFGNRLVQMDVSGAVLQGALENGVSRIGEGAGRFPHVAGLRFAFDAGKPAGQRIVAVEVGTVAGGYRQVDARATYRLVTNDFVAYGGDGYEMLRQGSNLRGGDVPLDAALIDYIHARGTLDPKVEGRIVPGALPAAPPLAQATLVATPIAGDATVISPTPDAPPSPVRSVTRTMSEPTPAAALGTGSPFSDVQTIGVGIVLVFAVGSLIFGALRQRKNV